MTKRALVRWDGGMHLTAEASTGDRLEMDDDAGGRGFRPSELVMVSLGGCTAMDVISILRKKRQDVRGYSVETAGVQMDVHPHAYTRIDVTHIVTGVGVDPAAVARAIELSATKYCSVGSTLATGITEVHHSYRLIDAETGAESSAEVLVEGPRREIAVPAEA